jgi:hypothetical protein
MADWGLDEIHIVCDEMDNTGDKDMNHCPLAYRSIPATPDSNK